MTGTSTPGAIAGKEATSSRSFVASWSAAGFAGNKISLTDEATGPLSARAGKRELGACLGPASASGLICRKPGQVALEASCLRGAGKARTVPSLRWCLDCRTSTPSSPATQK